MEALSVSQVQTYLGCALKYRFQYVERIPRPWRVAAIAFGASIHAAVEAFLRGRMDGKDLGVDAVLSTFNADWYAQNVEPLVFSERDSRESLTEKGCTMVRVYVEAANGINPQAVEERFALALADPKTGEDLGVTLHGVIDLVEENGTIVELKTANRALEDGALDRHLQLSTYALARFLLKGTVPKLRLDQLLKTKVPRLERYETSRTLEDLSWTGQLLKGVAGAIRAGHFFPNPSWRCSECEYFAHCQAWRG